MSFFYRASRWLLFWGVVSVFSVAVAQADVRLPRILAEHMVLQREQPIPIWGWAAPGGGPARTTCACCGCGCNT